MYSDDELLRLEWLLFRADSSRSFLSQYFICTAVLNYVQRKYDVQRFGLDQPPLFAEYTRNMERVGENNVGNCLMSIQWIVEVWSLYMCSDINCCEPFETRILC